MGTNTFEGKTGDEYDLLLMSIPHYTQLESSVGKALRKAFTKSRNTNLRVLEIGCGSGITTPHILEADPRTFVTCLDIEPIMIDQARRRDWAKKYAGRIDFVVEDASKYLERTKANSLDAVASAYTLHNLEKDKRRKVVKQIYDALTPEGVFVNADKIAQNGADHNKELRWQLNMFRVYDRIGRRDYREEWEKHYHYDNQPSIIWRERDLMADLRNAGFKHIRRTFRKHMEATYVARK